MTMLEAKDLVKNYKDKPVLAGTSFVLREREIVSIVGPSGEGKSTIARILCGTVKPDSGSVLFRGEPVWDRNGIYRKELRRSIQLIPQQPYASLDPRQKIGDAIAEPLLFYRLAKDKREAKSKAAELMERVQLPTALAERRPGELSGGQAQRALIARALSLSPSLLIADEATSMLDISSQAQIVRIFRELSEDCGLTVLLISHDFALVQAVSNRIYRLSKGKMLEINE